MKYCPRRWDTSRDTGPLAVHPVGFEQMSVGVGDGRVLYIIINVLGGKSSNKIISLLWFAYLYVPNEVDGAEDIRNWFFGRIISSERCLRFIIKNFGESIIIFLESYTFSTAKFCRYLYVASNLKGRLECLKWQYSCPSEKPQNYLSLNQLKIRRFRIKISSTSRRKSTYVYEAILAQGSSSGLWLNLTCIRI